jgi:hypothetical protein
MDFEANPEEIEATVETARALEDCKIWGFHGGDYEEWCLLGCYDVWLLSHTA